MSGKAQLMFSHPELKGIVTTVGSVVRNFSEDASLYGLTEKESSRLSRAVGLNERRVVGDKLTTTSDLCVQSAKYLLENLNMKRILKYSQN